MGPSQIVFALIGFALMGYAMQASKQYIVIGAAMLCWAAIIVIQYLYGTPV
jgi:hypothetical protein